MSNTKEIKDEITLKELILKVHGYFIGVLKNWPLILVVAALCAVISVGLTFLSKSEFNAKLTFMLSSDEGRGSSISAMFGQFIGGGGKGKNNLDKLIELSKARKIIQDAIFEKAEMNGKNTYLANHLIDYYDFHEKWADDKPELTDFYFNQDSVAGFNLLENTAFKIVYRKIVGTEENKGLFNGSYGDETNILKFSVKSLNDTLSIELCNSIYHSLSRFYIDRTIEKEQNIYDIVKTKLDSVSNMIAIKESQLARFKDSSLGLWTNKDKLVQARIQRDLQVLYQLFEATIKNHEITEHALKSQTPYIQLIDEPIFPIKPDPKSRLKALLLGGILGGFLSVAFVLGRIIYREIMA